MHRTADASNSDLPLAPSEAPAGEAALRVFVLADVCAFAEGLARLLRDEPSFEVLGSGPLDGNSGPRIAAHGASVVLLDGASPDVAAVARRLSSSAPGLKLLAIGVAADEATVLECSGAGIAGYVSRAASANALIESVRELAQGGFPCPREISSILFRHLARPQQRGPSEPAALTRREREIVALIDRGFTNREIASALCIELPTVKNHVHNILDKLRVRRRAAAAAKLRGAAVG
jgi:two-component system nitrate/nitrite response regulator NarL